MFLANIFGYVLNFLYNTLGSYGLAIIAFSILLRIILLPITINQQKSMKKSGKLQGELKEIQRKYKNNPEKLNQETIELYKREKMSPFSGCFSAIIQIFIILSVFWVVSSPLTYMRNLKDADIYKEYSDKVTQNGNQKASYKEIAMINLVESDYKELNNQLNNLRNNNENNLEKNDETKSDIKEEESQVTETSTEATETNENSNNNENVENSEKTEESNTLKNEDDILRKMEQLEKLRINMDFLGLDLSKVPTQSMNDFRVFIIPILYVISSFISIKLTNNMQSKDNKDNKNENNQKEPSEMDAMQNMSKSMTYMMPIMSISIAIIAPLGLALYWFISNVLMILERIILKKFIDSKEDKQNG